VPLRDGDGRAGRDDPRSSVFTAQDAVAQPDRQSVAVTQVASSRHPGRKQLLRSRGHGVQQLVVRCLADRAARVRATVEGEVDVAVDQSRKDGASGEVVPYGVRCGMGLDLLREGVGCAVVRLLTLLSPIVRPTRGSMLARPHISASTTGHWRLVTDRCEGTFPCMILTANNRRLSRRSRSLRSLRCRGCATSSDAPTRFSTKKGEPRHGDHVIELVLRMVQGSNDRQD